MANIIKNQAAKGEPRPKGREARSTKQGNYLNSIFNFFGFNLQPTTYNLQANVKGFTLIEYLVAIAILAALVVGVMVSLNPFAQIDRSRDAQRRQDLQQVKNALETYYQDNNCYPEEVPFGLEWSVNGEVYMSEVPQDPNCGQLNGTCYEYITDSDNVCPQWNVVFAKLSEAPAQSTTICPLSTIGDTCVPIDMQSESEEEQKKWACVMSGAVNCTLLAASGFGYDTGTGEPATGVISAPSSSPNAVTYNLGGEFRHNPFMRKMTIDPLWPDPPGIAQTFTLTVEDITSDIVSAKIYLYSDNLSQILYLSHLGGALWSGTIGADTYNNKFSMAIVARNANGNERCTVLVPGGYSSEPDKICDQVNNN